MKAILFFRSREWSNQIASSAQDTLRKERNRGELEGLELELINLDKRNYEKLFKGLEVLPQRIYVWFDEENLIDFVTENYPGVKICIYDKKEVKLPSNSKNTYSYGHQYEHREYFLANRIIADYRDSFESKEYWLVDAKNLEMKKEKIALPDLKKMEKKYSIFDNEDLAVVYLASRVDIAMRECDTEVETLEKRIKDIKAKRRRLNSLLNKILKIKEE